MPGRTLPKTKEKIIQLGLDVVPHTLYSPDLAPTDYHLFRTLSNKRRNKQFEYEDDMEKFKNLSLIYWTENSVKLLMNLKWQKIIEEHGGYIVN